MPAIQALLEEAIAATVAAEKLADDGSIFEPPPAPRLLDDFANLCFIAFTEVAARRTHVAQLTVNTPVWAMLVAAERACVEVTRGLCAVERELCELAGTTSSTRHVDLVTDSVDARVVATKFRRAVLAQVTEGSEAVRSAGTALARLIGRDAFGKLRVSDRLTARSLQTRALALLREREPDLAASERLIEDIRAFAVLLGELNQREELIGHDWQVLTQAIAGLADRDPHDLPPSAEVERLHRIYGRDDALDEMLVAGADIATVLARLLQIRSLLTPQRLTTAGLDTAALEAEPKSARSAGRAS